MRHNILLAAVAASLATTAMAQNYNVKGIIPGLRRGTKVSLRSLEQDRKIDAECTADDNTFVLSGTVQSPMLVELRINDKPDYEYKEDEYPKTRGTKFMLVKGRIILSLPPISIVFHSISRSRRVFSKMQGI